MKRTYSIDVGGQPLVLRSEADEAYVRKVAAIVDEKIREVTRSARAPTLHATLLVAIGLADDLLRERGRREALRRKVADRSRRLLELLDRGAD